MPELIPTEPPALTSEPVPEAKHQVPKKTENPSKFVPLPHRDIRTKPPYAMPLEEYLAIRKAPPGSALGERYTELYFQYVSDALAQGKPVHPDAAKLLEIYDKSGRGRKRRRRGVAAEWVQENCKFAGKIVL
jgi:hypothetical protein